MLDKPGTDGSTKYVGIQIKDNGIGFERQI
jgi:hypothetical protein